MRAVLKRKSPPLESPRAVEREALHELDDSQLVQRHLAGDPQAFSAVVDRYQTRLLNFINRTIGDRERAEIWCQEVFIRVFPPSLVDPTKKFHLIYTIDSNLGKNELRNGSPHCAVQTIRKLGRGPSTVA